MTQPRSLQLSTRLLLGLTAFAGSAAYAASFFALSDHGAVLRTAAAVGICAGLSWICFGPIILIVTRCRPSIASWIDACLLTMTAGIAVKTLGMLLNVAAGAGAIRTATLLPFHVIILLLADTVMCVLFCRLGRQRGIAPPVSISLWLALNALMGMFLFLGFKFAEVSL
jgi:hypothetical protein